MIFILDISRKAIITLKNFDSVGHKGIYGHEFLEFEFRPDGRLRYANNSNYKSDVLIRKEGTISIYKHIS